ncbi:MAG: hypothetical protein KGD57_02025 [Candidatus Lokiarchaeota archaeon]|nr:hypothetical protein [Candidatus Lokiarchaeota archaeon]
MLKFEIIPVIDILNSTVVHAIKGERSKYKKLRSYLFSSINPKNIIKVLNKCFNFTKFYVADLDAILTKRPNTVLLTDITSILESHIILDPGIETENDIKKYMKIKIHKLIFGLETIQNLSLISTGLQMFGKDNIIVSIDMYNGKILSKNEEIKNKKITNIVQEIENLGVKEIILLDLFRIGQKLGGIPKLYNNIKKIFNGHIYVGGGIRDLDDIKLYHKEGFSGVLIGTALYDGTIKISEIKSFISLIDNYLTNR